MNTTDTFRATDARHYASRILSECSDCFTSVKAVKRYGKWVIDINGGRAACYGRTIESVDSAEDTLRIFKNE